MAIAGRVAIVPALEYDATKIYKRNDFVRYGKNCYVARKESVGMTPPLTDDEFWMLSIEGGSTEATGINYDNAASGLQAENVQEALDEVAQKAEDAANSIPENVLVAPDGESSLPEEAPKVNADRLGGQLPSYYACAADLGGITFSVTDAGLVRASWDDGITDEGGNV